MTIPRPNPELMVIGDSLSQGFRSFSINANYASQCYGKVIADSQGWEFVVPKFPRAVLFDLEQIIEHLDFVILLGYLPYVFDQIQDNIGDWYDSFDRSSPASSFGCFDNVGIGGATVADMFNFTSAYQADLMNKVKGKSLIDYLTEMIDKDGPHGPPSASIMDLHLGINSRFVLNPSQNPDFDHWNQFEWARQRKPKRLIIHGGHNDGLYSIGGSGKLPDWTAFEAAYMRLVNESIAIASTCPEIVDIVFLNLPKVSCVANLKPSGTLQPNGYFEFYTPIFGFSPATLDGEDLEQADSQIARINQVAQNAIASNAPRIKIFDTFTFFADHDYKNIHNSRDQWSIGNVTIDNTYLEPSWQDNPMDPRKILKIARFKNGGLQGIDGMHCTAVGYALIACELLQLLNLKFNRDEILKKALVNEQLIQHFPPTLPDVLKLLNPSLTKVQRKALATQKRPSVRDIALVASSPFIR